MPTPGNGLYRRIQPRIVRLHGRGHGWCPHHPGAARATLTINGEPVVEPTTNVAFRTILYNEAVSFSGARTTSTGSSGRSQVGFVIAINAKNTPAAIAPWPITRPTEQAPRLQRIAAIQARTSRSRSNSCSDAGRAPERTDRELILTAMRAMKDNGEPRLTSP